MKMSRIKENQKQWHTFYRMQIAHCIISPVLLGTDMGHISASPSLQQRGSGCLLELCFARYLSLYFFFFPKGLQLGASLGAHCATLATRLVEKITKGSAVLSGMGTGDLHFLHYTFKLISFCLCTSQKAFCGDGLLASGTSLPLCHQTFMWVSQSVPGGANVSRRKWNPPQTHLNALPSGRNPDPWVCAGVSQEIANTAHREHLVCAPVVFELLCPYLTVHCTFVHLCIKHTHVQLKRQLQKQCLPLLCLRYSNI